VSETHSRRGQPGRSEQVSSKPMTHISGRAEVQSVSTDYEVSVRFHRARVRSVPATNPTAASEEGAEEYAGRGDAQIGVGGAFGQRGACWWPLVQIPNRPSAGCQRRCGRCLCRRRSKWWHRRPLQKHKRGQVEHKRTSRRPQSYDAQSVSSVLSSFAAERYRLVSAPMFRKPFAAARKGTGMISLLGHKGSGPSAHSACR
jgi:hypothetical protein